VLRGARAGPGRPTPTGYIPAGTRSPPASALPSWTRSAGYDNAIREKLEDATAVLDAFHVVRLGPKVMEETRRRVQQELLGHRGRKHDPLYRIRNALRAGAARLCQIERIEAGLRAGDPDFRAHRGLVLLDDLGRGTNHPLESPMSQSRARLSPKMVTKGMKQSRIHVAGDRFGKAADS
jgi:hypothetical protein